MCCLGVGGGYIQRPNVATLRREGGRGLPAASAAGFIGLLVFRPEGGRASRSPSGRGRKREPLHPGTSSPWQPPFALRARKEERVPGNRRSPSGRGKKRGPASRDFKSLATVVRPPGEEKRERPCIQGLKFPGDRRSPSGRGRKREALHPGTSSPWQPPFALRAVTRPRGFHRLRHPDVDRHLSDHVRTA